MKCADPVLCYLDSKGNRKFRHFSIAVKNILGIPKSHIVFDCGTCIHCRKKKALELATRCVLHSSLYEQNCFLTLTYDEKKEGYHNEFEYPDIQKFKKRLSQHVFRESRNRIRIFNVHEYGRNRKKHWHLVVFNWQPKDKILFTTTDGIPLYTSERLRILWPFGFSTVGDVSEASAMYAAQYMEKDFKNYNRANRFKSHSKHSGIGKPYFEKHYKQILMLGFIPFGGKKIPIPRYFRKLARRHWAHFNDPKLFFDTNSRKAVFRPFVKTEPSREISDLYSRFLVQQEERLEIQIEEWNETITTYLQTGKDPDFIKSAKNTLHDLHKRSHQEQF